MEVMADRALGIVPSLVGFSLGLMPERITLTYVATSERVAQLDAVQYLDGGPCESAVAGAEVVEIEDLDLLDEDQWRLFARAGAAAGVTSTLSLPIVEEGAVHGGVNLYAGTPNAFRGHTDELAEVFGAWAPGAVTNADLSFSTRFEAARAPSRLEDLTTIDMAVGVLVAAHEVSPDEARQQLRESAARAGIPEVALALVVIHERTN
jgi:GAF domain-containing protein